MEDFSRYGKNFQQKLVQLLFTDRYFADQLSDIIKPDYLELDYLQLLLRQFYKYKTTYDKYPTLETLLTLVKVYLEDNKDSLKDTIITDVVSFFKKIKNEPKIEDEKYIKDEATKFCKDAEMANAIIKSAKILQEKQSETKYEEIRSLLDRAMKAGTENNYGTDFTKDFENRYIPEVRSPITTGWDEIDSITKGGYGKGELVVYLAPTGIGKSFILAHHATVGLKLGKKVIYYSLELSESDVALRCDAGISGISLDELEYRKSEVYEKIKEVPGKLIVKQYPTNTASITTLRSHMDKLRIVNNFEPDIVIVDYGDLLKGSSDPDAYRLNLQKIFENLRGIAIEYQCVVITATQTNRSGSVAEVVTTNLISEAFNKCFVADFIFGFSRSIKEKIENKGKLYVAKNRKGGDGILFPCNVNWGLAQIEVLARSTELPDEDEETKKKNSLEMLKNKYLEMKKTEIEVNKKKKEEEGWD